MASVATPPASYSVSSPYFDPLVGSRIEVRLDGAILDKVISYDTARGYVLRYKTDESGHIVLNHARGDAECEMIEGNVTAMWKD